LQIEEQFQEGIMRALWEKLNHQRWAKSGDEDREYVLQAFEGDVEMPDQSDEEEDEETSGETEGTRILKRVNTASTRS
jgi:hypothetical protein